MALSPMLRQLVVALVAVSAIAILHVAIVGRWHVLDDRSPVAERGSAAPPRLRETQTRDEPTTRPADAPRRTSAAAPARCRELPLHTNATPVSGVAAVSLCWSGCEGAVTVRLTRAECERAKHVAATNALSGNVRLRAAMLRAGPHLLRLRLDGPEVLTVAQGAFRRDACEYSFAISDSDGAQGDVGAWVPAPRPRLRLAGPYRLGLELLYRDFAHVDESRDVWPELLKEPLLPVLRTASRYHAQQRTLPSRVVLRCTRGDADSRRDSDEHYEQDTLPVCDGRERDTSGTWRRVVAESQHDEHAPAGAGAAEVDAGGRGSRSDDGESSELPEHDGAPVATTRAVWTRVRVRKIRKEPILFEWALQSEPEAQWWPRACRVAPGASASGVLGRLAGRRVAVAGDSQLRALYYALVNTLRGFGDECVRNITTLAEEPRHCVANVKGSQRKSVAPSGELAAAARGAVIQVDYADDLFLTRIGQKLRGYDVVIAGFGQHPASKEHWKFDRYAAAVDARMEELKKIAKGGTQGSASPPLVVWVTAPHYPHTRAGYPVVVRDWRTDARLALFNNVSAAAARRAGFAVLDAFAISDAFMHSSPDQAHFSNFVAAEFVRMLFSILVARPS
jgi:hypothetical protein